MPPDAVRGDMDPDHEQDTMNMEQFWRDLVGTGYDTSSYWSNAPPSVRSLRERIRVIVKEKVTGR